MPTKDLQAVPQPQDQLKELQDELEVARRELLAAEAELAEEQAAVNAFRMHCRLKLDRWVERLLDLQARRQSLLTRLALLHQAKGYGIAYDAQDPFWADESFEPVDPEEEEELILPTDVPRDRAAEKRLYRELARRFHPDLGVTAVEIAYRTDMMASVNEAYASGNVQALYDLAGELDPEEAAALAAIDNIRIRSLRQEIFGCRRRARRARHRLANLRQENTARLWRKARLLDRDDVHWWEIVRLEIEQAIKRVETAVSRLQEQVNGLEAIQQTGDTPGETGP